MFAAQLVIACAFVLVLISPAAGLVRRVGISAPMFLIFSLALFVASFWGTLAFALVCLVGGAMLLGSMGWAMGTLRCTVAAFLSSVLCAFTFYQSVVDSLWAAPAAALLCCLIGRYKRAMPAALLLCPAITALILALWEGVYFSGQALMNVWTCMLALGLALAITLESRRERTEHKPLA